MKLKKMLAILVLAPGLMFFTARVGEPAPMGTAITYQGRLIEEGQPACDSFLASEVACLWGCAIREVGNAMYVYSGAGSFQNGSWGYPYDEVSTAIAESYARCSGPHMIIIKPGYYPDTMTLTIPALLTANGCDSVILGE